VKARRSTCRLESRPGEQTQIDYAKAGLVMDPLAKHRRVVYAFIATLSFSRHKFIQFVFTQDQASFTQSHVDMAAWFGGVTKVLTIDNLKTGILKAYIYDPVFNRAYADFAEHYHTHIDPCRSVAPRDKGKVELDVQTVRELFHMLIAEHPSATLAELNRYARTLLVNEYGGRQPQHNRRIGTEALPGVRTGLTHQPASRAVHCRSLGPGRCLPGSLHPDNGAPHHAIHRACRQNRPGDAHAESRQGLPGNELIKAKPLIEGKTTYTDWEDFPPTVQFALLEKTPQWLIKSARETGGDPYAELVTGLLSVPGFSCLHRVMGLRNCSKDYSVDVVKQAATLAL
jgi:hypothetical protein